MSLAMPLPRSPRVQVPLQEAAAPSISVIVPIKERPEPLDELYREYAEPLRSRGWHFEFLFVIEPWGAGLAHALEPLITEGEPIRLFEVGQTLTESALLQAGAEHAQGEVLITLPCYRRIEAYALPELVLTLQEGADLVVAHRWPRRDSSLNRLQNRFFHLLLGGLTGDRVHDVACGVRAMRREVLQQLPVYGDFHRFLPLFALREGYRVREVAAAQHPRDLGTRVFSPGVYLRRLVDVLGLFFLLRFTDKPLRFFGMLGSTFSVAGALLLVLLFVQRLGGQAIADRPLLLLSVLLLVLGFQAIALGLIGEIVVHLQAPARQPYRLAEVVTGSAPPPAATSRSAAAEPGAAHFR
jgi:hypothetical protein